MKTWDWIVVGGGISGLGLAQGCARAGRRTLVLEAADQPGGCIHSHRFQAAPGFWAELGAHTCYNSYGHLLDLVERSGLDPLLRPRVKRPYRLLTGDRLRPVFSRLHPLEAVTHIWRLKTEPKAGRSLREYYGRVLGPRNYRDLLAPAFAAVICQPADAFPAEFLFRPKPRRKDRPRSYTFDGGLSRIPEAVAGLPGLALETGRAVTALAPAGEGFEVRTEAGATLACRHLALAIPADGAARLLAPHWPELAAELSAIGMAEVDSVSVAVRAADCPLPPLAGIIAPGLDFYSAVARDWLPDPAYRAFSFHFRPGRADPEARLEEISRVIRVPREGLLEVAARRNRLPSLGVDHGRRLERIDRALASSGLALTGNYFLGVSIEDCLCRSADELERFGMAW